MTTMAWPAHRPSITLLGKQRPAFQVCGYTGLVLGFVQSSVLVAHLGLSELTLVGITGVIILTFFGLTMITKIITGDELIIYYHHEIAVIVTVTAFLRATGQPVLPYLDVVLLGVGLFLAAGRLGCLMAGCCHGRPWRWGVIYGQEHVDTGFPPWLAGVRLFPTQPIESAFALLVVGTGIIAITERYPSGTAFSLYVLVYAAGRFCFEFFRGDPGRPYWWGFSEAQWTSLAIAVADVWAERAGIVPFHGWHAAVPLILLSAMLAVGLTTRFEPVSRLALLRPAHIRELAEGVQLLNATLAPSRITAAVPVAFRRDAIHIVRTSLGVRISTGEVESGSRRWRHYSLSREPVDMSAGSARLLGNTIRRLHHPSCAFELAAGDSGVFHLMFSPDQASSNQ
jgi:hypothetical protein